MLTTAWERIDGKHELLGMVGSVVNQQDEDPLTATD